jgi:hypothetical protein
VKTLVIGRSPYADVVIADLSVAPHHAELVVTDDGRLHLTDGASEAGSWRQGTGAGAWVRLRQAFVQADEPLRLGNHRCTAGELLRSVRLGHADAGQTVAGTTYEGQGHAPRLRGRVERDPTTGEVVRRRL